MIQKLKVIVCTMICYMVGVVSIAVAQEKMPDLMPVVVNANQGSIEIRNIGKARAKPSQVIIVCSRFDSTTPSTPCAIGLHLPAYTKKWNMLSYDVPTLLPGASYALHLFAPDALPRKAGNYAMKITVDPGKRIAESNESNNYTRLDTVIKMEASFKPASGSKLQAKMLDLIAVASDPFFGIFYVENKGDAAAVASKLVMTCTQGKQNGRCPTSPEMERLYDGKLGGFVVNVPPLPAGKVQRLTFPMSNLAWKKGAYTFSLTADAGRVVAETSESNNTARKTFRWDTGVLRIVSSGHGKPVPISYSIYPSGDRKHISSWRNKIRSEGRKIQTPVDISLPTGVYQLAIYSGNGIGVAQWFRVAVKASKVVTQKVSFQQPGLLEFDIVGENHEKLTRVAYSIKASARKTVATGQDGSMKGSFFRVSLLPGDYDLHVYRKLSRFNASGTSPVDINPVMGADEEQIIRGIRIQSGLTMKKKFVFKHIEPGMLKVHVLSDGRPNQAYVNVASIEKNSPVLFGFDASKQIKLVPGRYQLTIRPKDEKRRGAFQNAGYGLKSVKVTIDAGETVEKRVNFVKARKGSLVLTVLVNGSRNEAKTGIRTAGRKGRFITIDLSKTDLLPGRYDVSVWPVERCLSPGGVDVFHGGVSGPRLRTRRLPDVNPVILHDVEIKPGERLKKAVEFKGVRRYTKVCM